MSVLFVNLTLGLMHKHFFAWMNEQAGANAAQVMWDQSTKDHDGS